MKTTLRIHALLWAAVLVEFALFYMQDYLTGVWGLSFTRAAGTLNVWNGIANILPVVILFFRDTLLKDIGVLLISSLSYSAGTAFIAMSIPSFLGNPCKELESECIGRNQEALFYTGMTLIAIGKACNDVSVRDFLGEKNENSDDRFSPPSDLILTLIVSFTLYAFGSFAFPYIKPWRIRFGIPAIYTAFVAVTFWTVLLPCWRYNFGPELTGSPLTNICRVFVASIHKMGLRHPSPPRDANRLYSGDISAGRFTKTRCLGCLEKAAIIREDVSQAEQEQNRWKLCTIEEVEEAKFAVRMVPIWLTYIICGVVSSTGNTYFVEQGVKLDRHIGIWNVPLPVLLFFNKVMKDLCGTFPARWLMSTFRRWGPPFGIAIGMVFSILCCIIAAIIEGKRLNVMRKHDLLDKPNDKIPMSIYWLLLQFFLLGGLDAFFEKSISSFYERQAPEPMKSCLEQLSRAAFGLGFMAHVLIVHVVGKVSEKGGKQNWFQFTLNKSRLDRYYWVLAVICTLNLVVFGVVASFYMDRDKNTSEEVEADIGGVDGGEPEDRHRSCLC